MKPEVRTLVQYLRDRHASGQVATYQEMSALLHMDVQYKARADLSRAIEIAERDYRIRFANINGVGYKPLDKEEIVTVKCSDRKRKIQNSARRWREDLETVDVSTLSNEALMQYAISGIELTAVEASVSEEASQRITAKVKQCADPLDFYKGVDVFALLGDIG